MMNREVENAFLRNPNAHFITVTNLPSTSTPFIELNLGENQIFRPRRILVDSRSSYTKIDLKSREGDCIINNDYICHASLLDLKTSVLVNNEEKMLNNLQLKIPVPQFPTFMLFPKEINDDYAAPFSYLRIEMKRNDKDTDTFSVNFDPKNRK